MVARSVAAVILNATRRVVQRSQMRMLVHQLRGWSPRCILKRPSTRWRTLMIWFAFASRTGINPHDIAPIEVVKAPAGEAMYGVRGANGVIVIKMKRPDQ